MKNILFLIPRNIVAVFIALFSINCVHAQTGYYDVGYPHFQPKLPDFDPDIHDHITYVYVFTGKGRGNKISYVDRGALHFKTTESTSIYYKDSTSETTQTGYKTDRGIQITYDGQNNCAQTITRWNCTVPYDEDLQDCSSLADDNFTHDCEYGTSQTTNITGGTLFTCFDENSVCNGGNCNPGCFYNTERIYTLSITINANNYTSVGIPSLPKPILTIGNDCDAGYTFMDDLEWTSTDHFKFRVTKPSGYTAEVFSSSDLNNWSSVTTIGSSTTSTYITDTSVSSSTSRKFYRVTLDDCCGDQIIGFVNVDVPELVQTPVCNPLNSYPLPVSELIDPPGDSVNLYLWDYDSQSYLDTYYAFGSWYVHPDLQVGDQGKGFFITSDEDLTIHFLGNVTQSAVTTVGEDYTFLCSKDPSSSSYTLTSLNLPAASGDKVLKWNTSSEAFDTSTYNGSSWSTNFSFDLGEGFFMDLTQEMIWTESISSTCP